MSYDLNIMIFKQETNWDIDIYNGLTIANESKRTLKYTNDLWRFISNIDASWYEITLDSNGVKTAYEIIDSDFDKECKDKFNWIEDEDILSNLTPIIFNNKYKESLKEIMNKMLDLSSIKTILFKARYQGGDKEFVEGVIPFEKFKIMMDEEKLMFNICYIIEK